MIKKLSIVFAALLAVMSIHAQDEKPRHEIGVAMVWVSRSLATVLAMP
jgi:uncharacterized protein YlxP (DUF503 family)